MPSVARADGLPREVDPVFERALAKDPKRPLRLPHGEFVADLRGALARCRGNDQRRSPRPGRSAAPARVLVPVALLLLAAAIGAGVAAIVSTSGGSNAARS